MPIRSKRSDNKAVAAAAAAAGGGGGGKGKTTRALKVDINFSLRTSEGGPKVAAPTTTDNADKLRMKLYMVEEEIRNKKNRLHAISASQLDDDIVIEENGWKLENKEYESEKEVLVSQDDENAAGLEQKIQRLERKNRRAEKIHGARLEHLKQELEKKREESEKEAKRLNEEIETLRLFRQKVTTDLEAAL